MGEHSGLNLGSEFLTPYEYDTKRKQGMMSKHLPGHWGGGEVETPVM